MRLRSQFAQSHFGMLQGLALCAKGSIAQARSAVSALKTIAPVSLVVSRAGSSVRRPAVARAGSIAELSAAACGGLLGFLLAWAVISPHSHYGSGWFGWGHGRGNIYRFSRCLGITGWGQV